MKLLLIAPYIPYPPDNGGKIRVYNLIKCLSAKHEIVLLCFDSHGTNHPLASQALKPYCSRIEIIALPARWGVLHRLKASLVRKLPGIVADYDSAEGHEVLRNIIQTNRPDLICVEQLHAAQYAMNLAGLPRILIEQNIEHLVWRQFVTYERSPLHRLVALLEWKKVQEYELAAWKKFDRVVVVSQKDRDTLCALSAGHDGTVVPNGVDTSFFRPAAEQISANNLLFTGTMGYPPNLDGVRYFHAKIFSRIQRQAPDARLFIVGQNSPRSSKLFLEVLKLARKDIIITGHVDDVRPYFANAKVFVVPLRMGGGTRLKILEAMASGVPVVSTTVGCEGIEAVPGRDILIADDPESFACYVVELLQHENLRKEISSSARKLVESKYDWKIIADELNRVCEQVVDNYGLHGYHR